MYKCVWANIVVALTAIFGKSTLSNWIVALTSVGLIMTLAKWILAPQPNLT